MNNAPTIAPELPAPKFYFTEHDQRRAALRIAHGDCPMCRGWGEVLAADPADTDCLYVECRKCGGTGAAVAS